MLAVEFGKGTVEGVITTEPLVNDYSKRILITRGTGFPSELLRRHVARGSRDFLYTLGHGAVNNCSNAKVAEHHFIFATQQHIFWLDVLVDESSIMDIL